MIPDSEYLLFETLLHTKLEIPTLTTRVLRRTRLTSLFEKPGERKVILLTAPAGYGKTTLIGEWLSLTSAPDHRTAWVTLDLFDNAPFRFWSYLIASIKKAYPVIKFREETLLARGYDPLDFLKLIPLINEIGNLPGYLNLILDDYHTITDDQINMGITYLIDHMPRNMHLVISSRSHPEIPLARLRTLGRLVEITSQDLAFSFDETRKYLADTIQKRLMPDEIVEIYENTEGWIAGLKMAVITHETGRNSLPDRSLGITEDPAFPEYFSEEVLKNQDPCIREFLLKTSILSEFSFELCNNLLEIDNSQQIIDKLVNKNLFIESIDHGGVWFRYHPLFARTLSHQLQKTNPAAVSAIHNKALDWFLKKGFPEKAVVHALQSEQEEKAAEIIDNIAMQAIINFDLIKLIRWIDAIPDRLITLRPRLGIFNATACFLLGQNELAESNLVKTESKLDNLIISSINAEEIRFLRWHIEAIRAAMIGIAGDHAKGLATGKRLLQDKSWEDDYVYAMLTYAMGMTLEAQGLLNEATRFYDASHRYGLAFNYFYGCFHSTIALAQVHMSQGRLNDAKQEFNQALDFAVELNLENATVSLAQTGLLEIALEQNDLSVADKLAQEVLVNFDKTIFSESVWIRHIDRCVSLANYFVKKNDLTNAGDYFERALKCHYDSASKDSAIPAGILDAYVRILRAEARNNGSKDWSQTAANFLNPVSLTTPAGQMLQARIYLNQGDSYTARDLLSKLVKELKQTEYFDQLIQALAIFALSLFASSDKEAAFTTIEEALQAGSTTGTMRVFLEEGEPMRTLLYEYMESPGFQKFESMNPGYLANLRKLLDLEWNEADAPNSLEEPVMTTLHLLREPLSGRELEVLNMLVSGRSTKEIAEGLMVSVNTTKTHVMNIFRKFDVHSRKMLINRIKELDH